MEKLLLCRIKYLNKYIRKRTFYLYLQINLFFFSQKLLKLHIFICMMHQKGAGRCHEGNRAEGFHIQHPFRETQVPQALVWVGLAMWVFSIENAIRFDVLKRDFDQWICSGRVWVEALISSGKSQIGWTKPRQTKMCIICSKDKVARRKINRVQADQCEAKANTSYSPQQSERNTTVLWSRIWEHLCLIQLPKSVTWKHCCAKYSMWGIVFQWVGFEKLKECVQGFTERDNNEW